jgi:transcriptional regulator with XRE-family HTH domain
VRLSSYLREDVVSVSSMVLDTECTNNHGQERSMKINAELVLKARKQKSWSQDELAIASGLNLRSIQRIESEASASLQSKKALASALDLDVQDLDYEENFMPQKWEYKMVETKDRTALQPELDKAGADGWELVSVTSMFNTMMTKVLHTLFFKRPRS